MAKKKTTKKGPTKKIEITRSVDLRRAVHKYEYAYGRPGAETWSDGYASAFTARRGAERFFKKYIAKGGSLTFINNY